MYSLRISDFRSRSRYSSGVRKFGFGDDIRTSMRLVEREREIYPTGTAGESCPSQCFLFDPVVRTGLPRSDAASRIVSFTRSPSPSQRSSLSKEIANRAREGQEPSLHESCVARGDNP